MKQTTYTIQLWLNDKDEKIQLIPNEAAKELVKKECIKYFGWASIQLIEWVYTHENWTVITENTVSMYIITDKPINEFVANLKQKFNQESVAVAKAIEEIEFM